MTAISRLLIWLGVIVTIAAVVWWYMFFNEILSQSMFPGGTVWDASACIYSMGGQCGMAIQMVEQAGITTVPAYQAVAFWAGIAAIVVGVLLRLTARPPVSRA